MAGPYLACSSPRAPHFKVRHPNTQSLSGWSKGVRVELMAMTGAPSSHVAIRLYDAR
jgi:hypothetical protein